MTIPRKSKADQIIEAGRAITSVFFSLVFIGIIVFFVLAFWH